MVGRIWSLVSTAVMMVVTARANNVTVLAFLECSPRTATNLEVFYLDAYKLAFSEVIGNQSFADLGTHDAETLFNQYVVPGSNGLTYLATVGEGNFSRNINFRVVDVTGFASKKSLIEAKMSEEYNAEVNLGNFVVVVGGYSTSRETIKANWAKTYKVPFISGGGAESSIYQDNPYAFGLLSPVSMLAESTMKLLDKFVGSTLPNPLHIVLLWEDAAHGESYRDAVISYAAKSKGRFKIVFNSTFPYNIYTSKSQFNPLINEIKSTVGLGDKIADAFLVDAHSRDFVLMHQALSKHDISFKAITYGARGTDAADIVNIEEAIDYAKNEEGKASVEGIFAGLWWSPGYGSAESMKFVTSWRKHEALMWVSELDQLELVGDLSFLFRSPDEQLSPSWFGATGYEAMRVMLLAILQVSGEKVEIEASDILAALQATNVSSILPGEKIVFDVHGQTFGEFAMAQNQFDKNGVDKNSLSSESVLFNPYIVYPDGSKTFIAYQGFQSPRPYCGPFYFDHNISMCNSNNERVVQFFWKDEAGEPCSNPLESCFCNETTTNGLPRPSTFPCNYMVADSAEANAVVGLAWAGFTVAMICTFALLGLWRRPGLVGAHKPYLIAIALGCIWSCLSAITLIGENTEESCQSRMWSILLSLGFIISLLLGRVMFWYRVWSYPTAESLNCSAFKLSVPPTVSMSICLLCVGLWVGLQDTYTTTQSVIGEHGVNITTTSCQYASSLPGPAVTGSYFVIMLFVCVLFSYQAKDCDGKYFDSWYLFIATFNVIFVALIVAVLLALVGLGAVMNLTFVAVALVWSSVGFTFFSFFPRISYELGCVVFGANRKDQGSTTAAQTTDSENMVKKYIHGRAKRPTSQATEYN